KKLSKPEASTELEQVVTKLYGTQVSVLELIDSTSATKKASISLFMEKEEIIGYLIWMLEIEVEEESKEKIKTLVIDEIVILPDFHKLETAKELVGDIETLSKSKECSMIEMTLPSQSFWIIPIFIQEGKFVTSALRVTKELQKRTEFVSIYNNANEKIKPEFTEVMVSKNDSYQLEIIEEPTDYKKLLEQGFNPEIISMVFYIEDEAIEESMKSINGIAEWQEYSISLVKTIN
ncbi:MAG: hypothetical protein KAJ30_02075, partial [Candidatus Heimdallarchaeota archaeon]|nr:hypothetical protein [Candidatus Heimdallarchaeota archaeon]